MDTVCSSMCVSSHSYHMCAWSIRMSVNTEILLVHSFYIFHFFSNFFLIEVQLICHVVLISAI